MVTVSSFQLKFANISLDGGAFVTVLTILDCALLCLNTKDCVSYFYSPGLQSCAVSETRYRQTSQLTPQAGFNYYSKGKDVAVQCESRADCSLQNSRCSQGSCACALGYSFQHSNGSCVRKPLINVATNKTASASTSLDTPAYAAIDGTRTTHYYWWSCTASKDADPSPWWQVDVEKIYLVQKIGIVNRQDDVPERLHSLSIEVYVNNPEVDPTAEKQICEEYPGTYTGEELKLNCTMPLIGRYVRIQKTKKNAQNDLLQLCEVDVFASVLDGSYDKSDV